MLDIHQFLHDTIQPDQKYRYRSLEARGTNLIEFNRQGKPSYRCYTLETRKEILRRVLLAQEQLRREGPFPDIELIDFEELCAIRQFWLDEEQDWEDSLPVLHSEAPGRDLPWPTLSQDAWRNAVSKTLIVNFCQKRQLPPRLIMQLLESLRQFQLAPTVPPISNEAEVLQPVRLEERDVLPGQQESLLHLLEIVVSLLSRDWRDQETRLEEALARYHSQHEQARELPKPQPLLKVGRTRRPKKEETP